MNTFQSEYRGSFEAIPAPNNVDRGLRHPGFRADAPFVLLGRTWRILGWPLRYGAYDVDGLSVWGAPARILSQVGAILGR